MLMSQVTEELKSTKAKNNLYLSVGEERRQRKEKGWAAKAISIQLMGQDVKMPTEKMCT